MKTERLPTAIPYSQQLDALRGIAIIGVVLCHALGAFPVIGLQLGGWYWDWSPLQLIGSWGVPLFFLLSGYLLTRTEMNRYARGSYSVGGYLRRRALRLLPAYWASLLIYLALDAWLRSYAPLHGWASDLPYLLTMTHALAGTGEDINGAYWSLTPEVGFYLFLPFIIIGVRSIGGRILLYLLAIAAAVGAWHAHMLTGDPLRATWIVHHPITWLHVFLAGSLLAQVPPLKPTRIRNASSFGILACACSAMVWIAYNALHLWDSFGHRLLVVFAPGVLVTICFACYVVGCPPLRWIAQRRGLAPLGRISYSVFLLHNAVLGIAEHVRIPERLTALLGPCSAYVLFSLLVCMVVILVSIISYRYIEVPGMRLGQARRSYGQNPKPLQTTSMQAEV